MIWQQQIIVTEWESHNKQKKIDSKMGYVIKTDRTLKRVDTTSKHISSSMNYATKLHPLKLLTISASAEYVPTEEHTTPTIITVMQSPVCRHMK